MNQLNCRNCGAPHNGKCDYCGTKHYPTIIHEGVKKKQNWDSLTPLQKTALAIGIVMSPYVMHKLMSKK